MDAQEMKTQNRRRRQSTRLHSKQKSARSISDAKLLELMDYFEAKRARKEAVALLSLVKPSGGTITHLAAQDLKDYKHWIYRAAEEGRSKFFVDLGKLLEGKRLKPNPWSKLDKDVAFILCLNPKIKSTEAVELLRKLNHPSMSPLAFKQMRYNWKRAAAKTRERLEKLGWKYYGNSFLDGGPA